MTSNAANQAIADQLWPDGQNETNRGQSSWERYEKGWRPSLNPIQLEAYQDDTARYLLLDGERGSGKTVGALHKLVKHCFRNHNALGFVIVREVGQAREGGAWDKLIMEVLPEWRDGIGLSFTEPRMEADTKKPYTWVSNRFGGGSKISCFSLPVGEHVRDKIKGREPSFILLDEAQTTESEDYFGSIVQQLGRRKYVEDTQQIVYCANPDGPSHWLYKRFFEYPVDEETGEWDPAYARYHIPIQENLIHLPPGYYDNVLEAVRFDPIEKARMVEGIWIDRPSGNAIFKEYFNEKLHMRGDSLHGVGIMPVKGKVVIVSYDLGPSHSSIHFMQFVQLKSKLVLLVFDEVNTVGQYLPYRQVVPKILARMDYWNQLMGMQFTYDHISDSSAFTHQRPDGSYDALTVQQLSGERIRLRPAPKGKGSVAERVRMTMESLQQEEIIVSAICTKTKLMFQHLTAEKDDYFKPKRSPHLHVFDSLTYGPLAVKTGSAWIETGQTDAKIIEFVA